jgi:uncharacterized membrane protein
VFYPRQESPLAARTAEVMVTVVIASNVKPELYNSEACPIGFDIDQKTYKIKHSS